MPSFLVVLVPIGSIGIQFQVTTKGVVFGKGHISRPLMTKVSHFLEHPMSPGSRKYIKRVSIKSDDLFQLQGPPSVRSKAKELTLPGPSTKNTIVTMR